MLESKEVENIEARLKVLRVTKHEFLKRASVAASTLQRIRNGGVPNGKTMRRLREAMAEFEREAGSDASATTDQS